MLRKRTHKRIKKIMLYNKRNQGYRGRGKNKIEKGYKKVWSVSKNALDLHPL